MVIDHIVSYSITVTSDKKRLLAGTVALMVAAPSVWFGLEKNSRQFLNRSSLMQTKSPPLSGTSLHITTSPLYNNTRQLGDLPVRQTGLPPQQLHHQQQHQQHQPVLPPHLHGQQQSQQPQQGEGDSLFNRSFGTESRYGKNNPPT